MKNLIGNNNEINKKKYKKSLPPFLKKDAGNVDYNISMFNKMNDVDIGMSSAAGMNGCSENLDEGDYSVKNLKEALNQFDHYCIDNDKKFYDLRSMYENVQHQLTSQEKQELRNLVNTTNDPDAIKAYLDSKDSSKKNEDLDDILMESNDNLTYDELIDLAHKYYKQGGAEIIEFWDENSLKEYEKEFGPLTKETAIKLMKVMGNVTDDEQVAGEYYSKQTYENLKESLTKKDLENYSRAIFNAKSFGEVNKILNEISRYDKDLANKLNDMWNNSDEVDKNTDKLSSYLLDSITEKLRNVSEAYIQADKDILKIIRNDPEYGKNYHNKNHIPDFSNIKDGTMITLKGLNHYHPEVYATIVKNSDNDWTYTYYYNDKDSWTKNLNDYLVMREISEVDRGAYECLTESDDSYKGFVIKHRADNPSSEAHVLVYKDGKFVFSEDDIEAAKSFIDKLCLGNNLEEDYTKADDEWGEPYTYKEVEKDLRSITKDFTDKEGTVRCWYEQEKIYGVQVLRKHYRIVEPSDGRVSDKEDMSWVIAYADPKESKK